MKKILMVTDAWTPQVNGVVHVLKEHINLLKARGYEVVIMEPSQYKTVPMPMYPEISLALFARRRVARIMDEIRPDAIHIATEGPLGWAVRSVCLARGIPFTTWYHTKLQLYVDIRQIGRAHV